MQERASNKLCGIKEIRNYNQENIINNIGILNEKESLSRKNLSQI